MEVLHFGYLMPFHHLPPMLQEPLEFPSYSLRSLKAQAFQDEVDKMLGKSALELVKIPGPGLYSMLFLVQKAIVGWKPVIGLLSLKYATSGFASVVVNQEREYNVLNLP